MKDDVTSLVLVLSAAVLVIVIECGLPMRGGGDQGRRGARGVMGKDSRKRSLSGGAIDYDYEHEHRCAEHEGELAVKWGDPI